MSTDAVVLERHTGSDDGPDSTGRVAATAVGTTRRLLERWAPPALAAAALLAVSLPFVNRRPVWLDEAYTIGATRDLMATWRGSGGTQALYYLLMWPVTRVSIDQAWVRLPSAVCAAATVVVVHELGRRLGGRWAGATAAGLLASTWGLARYAIEARSYALTILLVSVSWLGLVASLQADPGSPQQHRWRRVWVAAALLMPLAHGLAALQFAGQLLAVLVAPDRRRWLRTCGAIALGLAAEAVLLFTLGAGEVAEWVQPLSWGQVRGMGHLLFGYGLAGWIVGAAALAAAVAVLVPLVRGRGTTAGPTADAVPAAGDATAVRAHAVLTAGAAGLDADAHLATSEAAGRLEPGAAAGRSDRLMAVPLLWLAVMPVCVLLLSLLRPYGEPRYLLSSLPAVALLIGLGSARIRPRGLALAATVVVAALLMGDHTHVTAGGAENWPGVVDHVAARAGDGDRLLTPTKYRPPVDYWWGESDARPRLVPLSPVDRLGEVRRFYDVAEPRTMAERMLEGHRTDPGATVWYVDRSDGGLERIEVLTGDPEILERYSPSAPVPFKGDLYVVRFTART